MEFQIGQNKFLTSKKTGVQILKGTTSTGKTTVSIYKAVDLEKNYCIYDKDKVLVINGHSDKLNKAKEIYEKANVEMENNFYSLFSLTNKKHIEFNTIQGFIASYVKAYIRENKLKLVYITEEKKVELLSNVYNDFNKKNKFIGFMKNVKIQYLLDEIEWVKANYFTKHEYRNTSRLGRGKALRKNSKTRDIIYEIKDNYSYNMHRLGYMDKYDESIFAINYSEKIKELYSHIIIDDCQRLTRGELLFISKVKNRSYGSFILVMNTENKRSNSFINARVINELIGSTKGKIFTLRTKLIKNNSSNISFIDKYEYIDLVKVKNIKFEIDSSNVNKEIILDEYVENDLIEVPVYSDIAAGEPILINDIEEGIFHLPRNFIGKSKGLFMLHVKGDSMIEKNINDGDFVVVKSQNSACHNEIVAVAIEGKATLKTLSLSSEEALLMPANSKYEPIKLKGKESSILGVVLGILKSRNN